ncbi:hypothetical protein [Streptomyces sp. NPDC060322]
MLGSADLTTADRAAKDSLHRANQAAKQAEAARTQRQAAEAQR